jgi:tRNA-specific 2-thiouridylase
METKKKTVFVGLSGGVDSSVTAGLLKQAGYEVVGVFIRTWQPDFIECNFREDRLDAMRVAVHLDIPFLECDAEEEYKKAVADYMIAEYKLGRTPNPDVMCNREIKFGVFWNFAKAHGADFIATGHYAEIQRLAASNLLLAGKDKAKDQSYFLYRLTSDDLEHVLFPLGGMKKSEVRELAEKFGLPTAKKKDSQGICMLGDLDLKDFLSHYIPPIAGDVLNESGQVIGYHDGAVFLTLGERHGFTITKKTPEDDRYYIVGKDVEKNTITVSNNKAAVSSVSAKKEIKLSQLSWVESLPEKAKKYTAQIRYHGDFLLCGIEKETVIFDEPVLVAPGQSIVIYEDKVCLGGGIVA